MTKSVYLRKLQKINGKACLELQRGQVSLSKKNKKNYKEIRKTEAFKTGGKYIGEIEVHITLQLEQHIESTERAVFEIQ